MKKVVVLSTIAALAAFSTSASALEGTRIEFRASAIDVGNVNDSSNGFGARLGYDINNIVGFNFDADIYSEENDYFEDDITSFTLSSDVGYTFSFDGNHIKPYVLIGARHANIDGHAKVCGYNCDFDVSDNSIVYGIGIRAVIIDSISAGIEYNKSKFHDANVNQTVFSVGYKF